MSNVKRVYVEKKSGFEVQARSLRLRSAAILESKTWTVFVY